MDLQVYSAMGVSNFTGVMAAWVLRHTLMFDHPLNAFYSLVVRVMFSFLNNSRTKQDTHQDGALPIVMFGKIDLVGQSCGTR